MDQSVTAIERAFHLARSGSCRSVEDIKKQLHLEGYSHAQITGPTIRKQLRELILAAAARTPPTEPEV